MAVYFYSLEKEGFIYRENVVIMVEEIMNNLFYKKPKNMLTLLFFRDIFIFVAEMTVAETKKY
jgi:hypothetical protein